MVGFEKNPIVPALVVVVVVRIDWMVEEGKCEILEFPLANRNLNFYLDRGVVSCSTCFQEDLLLLDSVRPHNLPNCLELPQVLLHNFLTVVVNVRLQLVERPQFHCQD